MRRFRMSEFGVCLIVFEGTRIHNATVLLPSLQKNTESESLIETRFETFTLALCPFFLFVDKSFVLLRIRVCQCLHKNLLLKPAHEFSSTVSQIN